MINDDLIGDIVDGNGAGLACLASFWIAFTIAGIYYLVVANTWDHRWTSAILKRGEVYTKTSCDSNKNSGTTCSNTYYVEEIFYKGPNITHTCTVRRLTPYYFKGNANAFVDDMVLGTTRNIYQTTYSSGTCFDDKIRSNWNIQGGIYTGFAMIPVIIVICFGFLKR